MAHVDLRACRRALTQQQNRPSNALQSGTPNALSLPLPLQLWWNCYDPSTTPSLAYCHLRRRSKLCCPPREAAQPVERVPGRDGTTLTIRHGHNQPWIVATMFLSAGLVRKITMLSVPPLPGREKTADHTSVYRSHHVLRSQSHHPLDLGQPPLHPDTPNQAGPRYERRYYPARR
jgi:hypothetical protein